MSLFMNTMRFKPCWGFVLYRTDYSSEREADWAKFLEMYKEWTARGFSSFSDDMVTDIQRWHKMTWMTDPRHFNEASFEQLREHFRCWSTNWLSELKPGLRNDPWPESYMFMVVDKEVLEHIHGQDPNPSSNILTNKREEFPYVKAVDKNPLSEGDSYPGWMKVSLSSTFSVYYKGLSHASMRCLRLRSSDWYERDVYKFETYSDVSDSDESESEL